MLPKKCPHGIMESDRLMCDDCQTARETKAKQPKHPTQIWAEAFTRGEDFRPDWVAVYSEEDMKRELDSFNFKGTGWYLQKGHPESPERRDKIYISLVLPTSEPGRYLFCSYGERDPGPIFGWINNAPTRVDER